MAKRNFHISALDINGKKILSNKISRDDLLNYIQDTFQPESLIAMEACGGCNFWGQQLKNLGYVVKLLKPKDVKAYAKSKQKNDINDALAIAKAALDPELKEVQIKDLNAQIIAFLHKTRQNIIIDRIQKSNGIQSSLEEFGFVSNIQKATFKKNAREEVEKANISQNLPEEVYKILLSQVSEIEKLLQEEIVLDKKIKELNKKSEKAKTLETIPGIGPINASILSIQAMETYKYAKDFSASLGLVPKQFTTGGNIQLGSITKQGNRYVRTMLIQGARSIVMRIFKKDCPDNKIYNFAKKLITVGKGFNLTCVAVANKLARIAFACVTKNEPYIG